MELVRHKRLNTINWIENCDISKKSLVIHKKLVFNIYLEPTAPIRILGDRTSSIACPPFKESPEKITNRRVTRVEGWASKSQSSEKVKVRGSQKQTGRKSFQAPRRA